MATYYMDYVNGNDANSGADWANAWKTITSGATAARIAPGDIVRIAKSPDPTSLGINGTWTNLSRTVTLASALTLDIEDCEDAWVASGSVTCTTSTTNKAGTNSASIAIAAGFTTGKVAYEALAGSTDFSGYKQISFWIRPNAAVAAGVLTLDLCSDAAGATPVDTFSIPQLIANGWHAITIDKGSALGAAIQSISLNAVSDPGTVTILLDNIIACKDSTSADSLSLTSLISKNSSAQGGNEGWFGIQSISGTTVKLDAGTGTEADAGRGYSGTTETVTTYKRETIKTARVTGAAASQEVQDSGTSGNNIQFQGGYDTATSTQNGETFFDGVTGIGQGISFSGKNYVTLNWIALVKYSNNINLQSTSTFITLDNISNLNCAGSNGITVDSTSSDLTINSLLNCNNNNSNGISVTGALRCTISNLVNLNSNGSNALASSGLFMSIGTISNCNNNGNTGLFFGGYTTIDTISNANNNANNGISLGVFNRVKTISNANSNAGYGVNGSTDCFINSVTTSGNTTASMSSGTGNTYVRNLTFSDTTAATWFGSLGNRRLCVDKLNSSYSKIFTDGGNIVSQASTLTNGSGTEWKLTTETTTDRTLSYPLILSIAKIAVTANNLVTVKAWFKKGHATNIGAKLVCRGGQISGVTSDVTATKADDTSEEELTITFTPTEAGVVEIEAWAYYVAGHSNVIVDAMTVTQA